MLIKSVWTIRTRAWIEEIMDMKGKKRARIKLNQPLRYPFLMHLIIFISYDIYTYLCSILPFDFDTSFLFLSVSWQFYLIFFIILFCNHHPYYHHYQFYFRIHCFLPFTVELYNVYINYFISHSHITVIPFFFNIVFFFFALLTNDIIVLKTVIHYLTVPKWVLIHPPI